MWFRRKKTKDINSTPSTTPVSHTSVPEEEKPAPPDSTTIVPSPTTQPQAESTIEMIPQSGAGNGNIKNAVASDEHLDWDFKVDLAAEEEQEKRKPPTFLQAVESEGLPELEVPDTGTVVPIRREPDEREPGHTPANSDDDVPVLRNIVYLTPGDETDGDKPDGKKEEPQFVEQCLKDIKKRLKRYEMSPLTAYQERQFRIALTSLKLQKDSGKFE